MRIRHLNFNSAKQFISPDFISFIKPHGGTLHRVFQMQTGELSEEKINEQWQVLNTLCKNNHNGIWYFDLSDMDTWEDIGSIFLELDLIPFKIELDSVPSFYN